MIVCGAVIYYSWRTLQIQQFCVIFENFFVAGDDWSPFIRLCTLCVRLDNEIIMIDAILCKIKREYYFRERYIALLYRYFCKFGVLNIDDKELGWRRWNTHSRNLFFQLNLPCNKDATKNKNVLSWSWHVVTYLDLL